MFISEISMHNFMPYYGRHALKMPKSPNANVFAVIGSNMRGKTSLLNAVRWCLYGTAYARHGRKIQLKDLVNRDAADSGDWKAEVSLKFSHDGEEYSVRRAISLAEHINKPREDVHFTEQVAYQIEGNSVSEDRGEQQISKILSPELSKFYLFDGEQLQQFEMLLEKNISGNVSLKTEIETLLGLPALTIGKTIIKKLRDETSRQLESQKAANDFQAATQEKLAKERAKLEALNDEILDMERQLEEISAEIRRYEELLDENAGVLEIRSQIKAAEQSIEYLKEDLEEAHEAYRELSSELWRLALGAEAERLEKEIAEKLRTQHESLRSQIEINLLRSALDSLDDDGTCPSCLQQISSDAASEIRRRIDSYVDATEATQAEDDYQSLLATQQRLRRLIDARRSANLENILERIQKATFSIYKKESEIGDLRDEIRGIDLDEVNKANQKLKASNEQRGRSQAKLEEKRKAVDDIEEEIDRLTKSLMSTGGISSSLQDTYRTYDELHRIFEKGGNLLRNRLRKEVQANASATFKKITTEPEYAGLKINPNFGLEIVDRHERIVAERSAGAEQVVALSLMDGLSQTAGRSAPIIMDTPFGRLDPSHRDNILQHLPAMSNQVILLVHEGELNPDRDLPVIGHRIGAVFRIKRISSSRSKIVTEGV